MIVYRPSTPRAFLGAAAFAMAAVTMGVMVVLPAELEVGDAPQYVQAEAVRVPATIVLPGSNIDVVAESIETEEDTSPGHAALETLEPCVRHDESSLNPRIHT